MCHAGIQLKLILHRVTRSGAQIHSAVQQPRVMPMPDDVDVDDDKSKASFSYWGTGKITSQKPITKQAASVYSGESSAYARRNGPIVPLALGNPR